MPKEVLWITVDKSVYLPLETRCSLVTHLLKWEKRTRLFDDIQFRQTVRLLIFLTGRSRRGWSLLLRQCRRWIFGGGMSASHRCRFFLWTEQDVNWVRKWRRHLSHWSWRFDGIMAHGRRSEFGCGFLDIACKTIEIATWAWVFWQQLMSRWSSSMLQNLPIASLKMFVCNSSPLNELWKAVISFDCNCHLLWCGLMGAKVISIRARSSSPAGDFQWTPRSTLLCATVEVDPYRYWLYKIIF